MAYTVSGGALNSAQSNLTNLISVIEKLSINSGADNCCVSADSQVAVDDDDDDDDDYDDYDPYLTIRRNIRHSDDNSSAVMWLKMVFVLVIILFVIWFYMVFMLVYVKELFSL